MRMRRKRNLETRLEACSDILAARGVPMKDLKKAAEEYRALFDYQTLFGNANPVRLEIGCGRPQSASPTSTSSRWRSSQTSS